MSLDDLMTMISTIGFPIAVAGYLLIKFDKTIASMTEAITHLTSVIGGKE